MNAIVTSIVRRAYEYIAIQTAEVAKTDNILCI